MRSVFEIEFTLLMSSTLAVAEELGIFEDILEAISEALSQSYISILRLPLVPNLEDIWVERRGGLEPSNRGSGCTTEFVHRGNRHLQPISGNHQGGHPPLGPLPD